ncbi:MAG: hypothetical protein ABJN75_11530, partial [Hoeflea sp.]|uniref:hypothetical protein n=1 Tax=Hoeflea sp. TaxID=1940281 RepID=UPI0032975FCF
RISARKERTQTAKLYLGIPATLYVSFRFMTSQITPSCIPIIQRKGFANSRPKIAQFPHSLLSRINIRNCCFCDSGRSEHIVGRCQMGFTALDLECSGHPDRISRNIDAIGKTHGNHLVRQRRGRMTAILPQWRDEQKRLHILELKL